LVDSSHESQISWTVELREQTRGCFYNARCECAFVCNAMGQCISYLSRATVALILITSVTLKSATKLELGFNSIV